jgi:RND superfamily putative drug exporter
MFSVFASFITGDSMILKQIAFALAVGVLIDAFLVRMTLVPAVLTLTGRAAWWLPRGLTRVLPNLDIEGESLRHHHGAEPAGPATDRSPETSASEPSPVTNP